MNNQEKADFIAKEMARVGTEASDESFNCAIYVVVLFDEGQAATVMCSNPSDFANKRACEAILGGPFTHEVNVLERVKS